MMHYTLANQDAIYLVLKVFDKMVTTSKQLPPIITNTYKLLQMKMAKIPL
ncbi:hypothetical protein HanPSC8_Chr15g0663891 [Helianthus annuus]|nr:hypothetical protein HanPSC8_Chr15g0663891 [Helianthus annuus]